MLFSIKFAEDQQHYGFTKQQASMIMKYSFLRFNTRVFKSLIDFKSENRNKLLVIWSRILKSYRFIFHKEFYNIFVYFRKLHISDC